MNATALERMGSTMTTTVASTLDRRGKTITTFVVFDVAAELDKLQNGEVLEVLADDFEPLLRDVAAWCEVAGHSVVSCDPVPTGLRFLIEKGAPRPATGSLAVVISTDGLEELLSPLGFALAAALDGMTVHLYIQGPAVRVLTRGFRPKLHGWARPFSRFAAAGLTRAGHVPAQDKLRQLRSLGAHLYLCGPSMQHFNVKPDDLIFTDLPVVEYFSFIPIMANAQAQIYA
jgi:TusA-related sulfurtransferase/predicted peroxiredoxin